MSDYPPIDLAAHPELVAAGRDLDRALNPVLDRICARLGITRAELRAMPDPRRAADGEARETEAAK